MAVSPSSAPAIQPDVTFDVLSQLALSRQDSQPVGGRLRFFVREWECMGADAWTLDVLSQGYAPKFSGQRPPLTSTWKVYESSTPSRAASLQTIVEELLRKEAIEEVTHKSSLGFYSHLFLVPKKNGQLRPVINLRPLNEHLEVPSFKMETVASVSAAIQPSPWI